MSFAIAVPVDKASATAATAANEYEAFLEMMSDMSAILICAGLVA